jgi:hypothetical protein
MVRFRARRLRDSSPDNSEEDNWERCSWRTSGVVISLLGRASLASQMGDLGRVRLPAAFGDELVDSGFDLSPAFGRWRISSETP